MKINIGANVKCRGEHVGTIKCVILDPTSFDVHQIVVARGGLLAAREVLVPVERIYEGKDEAVTLDMDRAQLEALPAFEEGAFVPINHIKGNISGPSPFASIGPSMWPYYLVPQVPAPEAAPATAADKAPEGAAPQAIKAGMEVYAGEHKVGEISKVIMDSSDKAVTGFVIARGWLFTHNFEVPTNWVVSITGERILLNRTREQIEELDKAQQQAARQGGEPPA
jgi:uncharacterized protein YrrD